MSKTKLSLTELKNELSKSEKWIVDLNLMFGLIAGRTSLLKYALYS